MNSTNFTFLIKIMYDKYYFYFFKIEVEYNKHYF